MNFLAKLIAILHSDASSRQITAGLCAGLLMAFSPTLSVQGLLILLLALFIRLNIGGFMVAWGLFALASLALRPLTLPLGEWLLTHQQLHSLWTGLYANTVMQLTWFNHTRVLGEFALALVSLPLLTPLFHYLINTYRDKAMIWLKKHPVVQFLKTLRLFQAMSGLQGAK